MEKHIVLVDSREVFRRGLRDIFLEGSSNIQVHEIATIEELEQHILSYPLALVVIHQSMVIDVALLLTLPKGCFVVLAAEPDRQILQAACNYGRAYLLESASADLLRSTLNLCEGQFLFDPALPLWAREYLSQTSLLAISEESLTAREREVFRLLCSGLSNLTIAEQLGINESTVKSHVSHIMAKLKLRRRQLRMRALAGNPALEEQIRHP